MDECKTRTGRKEKAGKYNALIMLNNQTIRSRFKTMDLARMTKSIIADSQA